MKIIKLLPILTSVASLITLLLMADGAYKPEHGLNMTLLLTLVFAFGILLQAAVFDFTKKD